MTFGEELEAAHVARRLGLDKGMTQMISHYSRHGSVTRRVEGGRNIYDGSGSETAEVKIRRFYAILVGALLTIAVALFLATSGIF